MRLRHASITALVLVLAAAPALAQSSGSGSGSGGNSSSFNQGSGSQAGDGDSSSASQSGDTDTVINQRTDVESGNVSSGSQLTGVGGKRSPGAGGAGSPGPTVVPGTGGTQRDTSGGEDDTSFDRRQTPRPATNTGGAPGGFETRSERTAGDWAATAVVALLMLVGILFGIRKLPRAGGYGERSE